MEEYPINENRDEDRERCKQNKILNIGPIGPRMSREICSCGMTMPAAAIDDRDRITTGAARL